MDMVIVKDLKRYRKSQDAIEGEDVIDQQIDGMYSLLEPHKDRILVIGDGNHERTISGYGSNPSKRLAKMLGTKLGGYTYFLKLQLHENDARVRTITTFCHHGWGGACRTEGGSLTKYARHMGRVKAAICLYGHDHQALAYPCPIIGPGSGNKIFDEMRFCGLTGTFLTTYGDGTEEGYGAVKGYNPVALGGLIISLKPTKSDLDVSIETKWWSSSSK